MTSDPPTPAAPKRTLPKSYDHAPQIPAGVVELSSLFTTSAESIASSPLMLEIGPGRGRFALEYCEAFSHTRLLALEIRKKLAFQLDERFGSKKMHHRARCFAQDAREVLPRLMPAGAVSAVAIHFPDPWWKKRHQKRMVVGNALVSDLARLVHSNGVVLVQTDVLERAQEYFAQFAASPEFVSEGSPYVSESPFAPARSNREALAIEDGLPVFRMVFRRK
jgi:tRNA (guanine-N7-)-methyltransferase